MIKGGIERGRFHVVGGYKLNRPNNMKPNIDRIRNEFFKKNLSVGHHNVRYTWMQIMLMILNCIKCLESIDGGAKSPSAQTIRDRLNLKGDWLTYFHEQMYTIVKWAMKVFCRFKWYISIDETHIPFFGNRKKLNAKLVKKKVGKYVHAYRAKTPGATGSFCFLVISLCCCKIRIPLAIKMVKVGERYKPWLKTELKRAMQISPKSIVLADRGFGKAEWFYNMLEELDVKYVVRMPLRKKESRNKVRHGATNIQQWIKDVKTKDKVLLDIYIARDSQNRKYVLASNIKGKTPKQLLSYYLNRWDLENIFKDADRVELPTSSRNPLMRLFCVVASFLMFTLWQVSRAPPNSFWCSLRRFVKNCIAFLCNVLHCIISPVGEILRQPP